MNSKFVAALVVALFQGCLWAQTPDNPEQPGPTPPPAAQAEGTGIVRAELGGSANFVNNGYGTWDGLTGRFTFLRAKRFTPSFGFVTQKRPNGSQSTYGVDSYIFVNKWFYVVGGVGGSPKGTAELFPTLQYGATGLITVPRLKGVVATLGESQIHSTKGAYGRVLTTGAMYYHGRTIWSGSLSFNRTYPGAVPSKSGTLAVQYGAEKKYWIGAGMSGGRVAYNSVSLTPLDVRSYSFGPTVFFQKWITQKWGFIVKYGHQNYLDFYQSNGGEAKLFFEIP